jgi:hypothetical protein
MQEPIKSVDMCMRRNRRLCAWKPVISQASRVTLMVVSEMTFELKVGCGGRWKLEGFTVASLSCTGGPCES